MDKRHKKKKDKHETTILVHLTLDERAKAEKHAEQLGWSLSRLGRMAIEDMCDAIKASRS